MTTEQTSNQYQQENSKKDAVALATREPGKAAVEAMLLTQELNTELILCESAV